MRISLLASVALATAPLSLAGLAAPAAAQAAPNLAVVNVDAAIGGSAAAQTASKQMEVTYKADIDKLKMRQQALQTEITQKRSALQAAVAAAGKTPTAAQQQALQKQYEELQTRARQAQGELQQIQQPIQLAREFVVEQIGARLDEAMRNVMTKNKVDILLKHDAVEAYQPNVDLTKALITELNTLVPTVGIVPPKGWRPGGQGQQAEGAPAEAPAAPAPAPAQPQGR